MGITALHPGLLIAGLACIAIPILVHLLRRKHRPISWGAMRFLEQAYKKRKRLITVEQLLLLLTRCAIIALIAGGVGALILGSGTNNQRPRTLLLVIDNSIHSATILEGTESSLQRQQKRALELLETLDSSRGDRAALITTAGPAQGIAIPATTELGLIRSRVQSLGATDAERDLEGSLALLRDAIENSQDQSVMTPAFLLSNAGWDSEAIQDQSTPLGRSDGIETILLDVPTRSQNSTATTNYAITQASPLRPIVTRSNEQGESNDEIHGIQITLARSGDPNTTGSLSLLLTDAVSGTVLDSESIDWPIGQTTLTRSIALDPDALNATRGGSALIRVSIEIIQADSNPRDNTRIVGLPLRQQIRIGIIDSFSSQSEGIIRPSRWVRAVLGADERLISIQQINASAAADRIDPTLDMLFILTPSAIDDRGWSRIARLNSASSGSMPIVITPDADQGSIEWMTQLETLAPQLTDGLVQLKSYEPAIGLANTLTDHGLLSGIENEYAALASSVTLSRSLELHPGPRAAVLLRNSESQPIALTSVARELDSDSTLGSVVVLGFALDARWTDLPARPLFVAMMHETLRSLLARSISPDNRIAGRQASGLAFDNLEPVLDDQDTIGPRISGAFVRVDHQGTSRGTTIIVPDTQDTVIDPPDQESAHSAMARVFDDMPITDLSTQTDFTTLEPQNSSQGHSIALLLFSIAVVLGLIEIVLARRYSYTSIHDQSTLAGNGGRA